MRWLTIALVLLLPLVLGVLIKRGPPNLSSAHAKCGPGGCGSPGTNFLNDADCIGAWLISNAGDATTLGANRCSGAAASTDMVWQGGATSTFTATGPAGSPGGQDALSTVIGTDEYFAATDASGEMDGFESTNYTFGCWIKQDVEALGFIIDKGTAENYDFFMSSSLMRHRGRTITGLSVTSVAAGTWRHDVARYDDTGVSSDATDDVLGLLRYGVFDVDSAAVGSVAGNTSDLSIGASAGDGSDLGGDIMECFFMDRPLEDLEVCEIMLCGFDGLADGLARDAAFGATGCECSDITTCC